MKICMKDFFSICDKILKKLRMWIRLVEKFLMEKFIFVQWFYFFTCDKACQFSDLLGIFWQSCLEKLAIGCKYIDKSSIFYTSNDVCIQKKMVRKKLLGRDNKTFLIVLLSFTPLLIYMKWLFNVFLVFEKHTSETGKN